MICKFNFYIKICVILIYTIPLQSINAQEMYDCNNRLDFAKHIFNSSDYNSAYLEYNQISNLFPDCDSSKIMCVRSLCALKKYDDAVLYLERNSQLLNQSELFALYIQILLKINQYTKVDSLLISTHILHIAEQNTLELYSKLLNNKKKEALSQIDFCKEKNIQLPEFLYTIPNYTIWKYTLSSILLPGMGKILTHAPYDGIYSLYSTSFSSFVSYRAFSIKGLSSINGWVFGFVSAGLYIGNVYGTYKHLSNVPHNIIHQIQINIENNLYYTH